MNGATQLAGFVAHQKKIGAVGEGQGRLATWSVAQSPLAAGLGWRRGFLFPAAVLAIGVGLFLWKSRNRPEDEGLPAVEEDEPVKPEQTSWWATARNPEVMILAGMYFFLKITRYSLLFWLPLYLLLRWGPPCSSVLPPALLIHP